MSELRMKNRSERDFRKDLTINLVHSSCFESIRYLVVCRLFLVLGKIQLLNNICFQLRYEIFHCSYWSVLLVNLHHKAKKIFNALKEIKKLVINHIRRLKKGGMVISPEINLCTYVYNIV